MTKRVDYGEVELEEVEGILIGHAKHHPKEKTWIERNIDPDFGGLLLVFWFFFASLGIAALFFS